MIGITNAINMKTRWSTDNDTMLLITDSIEDKSHYQSTIVNNNVIVATDLQRDGRNTLMFTVNQSPYLEITDKFDFITGDKDYTIEWWGYHLGTNNNNGAGCIFHSSPQNSSSYGLLLGHNWSFPERTWYSTTQSGWNVLSDKYNSTGLYNHDINKWYHYAFVRKNTFTFSVYINGALRWTETKAATVNCILSTTDRTSLIGAYWDTNSAKSCINRHTFYLQDFRISSCARYTEPFTPPTRFI